MNRNIQPELDSLFDEWKTRLIVKDGILDENKYWESMPRIVFLLKEAYEDAFLDNIIAPLPENRSKGYAPCGNSYSFWRHVRGWQHVLETRVKQARGIIDSNSADKELEPAHVAGIKETPVTGVGYVNVKKAVGKNTSDWKDLYNHARNDADLLKKQIELLDPHIIFCCGNHDDKNSVFKCLKIIFAGSKITASWDNGIHIMDNRFLVVDWWHPAARGNYMDWENLDTQDRMNNPNIHAAIKALGWT